MGLSTLDPYTLRGFHELVQGLEIDFWWDMRIIQAYRVDEAFERIPRNDDLWQLEKQAFQRVAPNSRII